MTLRKRFENSRFVAIKRRVATKNRRQTAVHTLIVPVANLTQTKVKKYDNGTANLFQANLRHLAPGNCRTKPRNSNSESTDITTLTGCPLWAMT